MNSISINELLTIAIDIESAGELFYKNQYQKSKNNEIKQIFKMLEEDEVSHKELFSEILKSLTDINHGDYYAEEYYAYLKTLVDSMIFHNNREKSLSFSSDIEVIDYAISREKDSILFYLEMEKLVQAKELFVVEKIIMEERLHILRLMDIKEKIS